MAMTAAEIKQWVVSLLPDDLVAVDDGGLCLVVVGSEDYIEVGGVPIEGDQP